MNIRAILFRASFVLNAQCGIDPARTVRFLRALPRYMRDLRRFRMEYSDDLRLLPCLHDLYEESGETKNEYFWQDLYIAQMIFAANPERHVDVGSRVDGFIAHVASFRQIEVFDVRPIQASIPGVTFRQADLMGTVKVIDNYCDSLSCLHALEHFGLGRYGDAIDVKGHEKALANMARLLKEKGVFYLSVPIGRPSVQFNAHRIFDAQEVIRLASSHSLRLSSLTTIRYGGAIEVLTADQLDLSKLRNEKYALGVFVFHKLRAARGNPNRPASIFQFEL